MLADVLMVVVIKNIFKYGSGFDYFNQFIPNLTKSSDTSRRMCKSCNPRWVVWVIQQDGGDIRLRGPGFVKHRKRQHHHLNSLKTGRDYLVHESNIKA